MEGGTVRSYLAQIGQYCSSSRKLLHICPLFHGQIFCLHRSSKEIGLCFGRRIHYWWRGSRFECWYALSLQKFCLWTEDGNLFLCTTSEGFLLLNPGKQFILFYSKFKIAIAFLLDFGLDRYFVSLWEAW